MLCFHHLFAVWNGDRRLRDKWGEKADAVFSRTSVIPFAAILSDAQQLPVDYYKEFLRLPYLTIVIGTLGAYIAHPYMQAGSTLLHW
jgi:zeta-carotene isomerase